MANEKRVFQRDDAAPEVMYAKQAASDNDAYPVLSTTAGQLFTTSGLNIPVHDFIELAISSDTETYKFRTSGSSGTLVATVVVVYTSASRSDILTVTKT